MCIGSKGVVTFHKKIEPTENTADLKVMNAGKIPRYAPNNERCMTSQNKLSKIPCIYPCSTPSKTDQKYPSPPPPSHARK